MDGVDNLAAGQLGRRILDPVALITLDVPGKEDPRFFLDLSGRFQACLQCWPVKEWVHRVGHHDRVDTPDR